jgi:hypothetical protein
MFLMRSKALPVNKLTRHIRVDDKYKLCSIDWTIQRKNYKVYVKREYEKFKMVARHDFPILQSF